MPAVHMCCLKVYDAYMFCKVAHTYFVWLEHIVSVRHNIERPCHTVLCIKVTSYRLDLRDFDHLAAGIVVVVDADSLVLYGGDENNLFNKETLKYKTV